MDYSHRELEANHKTGRIAILSIMIVIIAFFCFLVRIDACTPSAQVCKEEFLSVNPNTYSSETCSPGAIAEPVGPPAFPKAGILCRCNADKKSELVPKSENPNP